MIVWSWKHISLHSLSSLHWHHNGQDIISNDQPHDCLPNRFFRRRSKKVSKLHVSGLCAGNSPETGEFPAQMASNAENVSIWWRHHAGLMHHSIVTSASQRPQHLVKFNKKPTLHYWPFVLGNPLPQTETVTRKACLCHVSSYVIYYARKNHHATYHGTSYRILDWVLCQRDCPG